MNKKIIGVLVSLIILYLTGMINFEGIMKQFETVNQFSKNEATAKITDKKEVKNKEDTNNQEETNNKKETKNQEETNNSKSNLSAADLADTSKAKDLKLYAQAAVLMDASNSRVLYEKNGYKEMPMASTTKIMTCIVTLENANPDDVVTISKYAASMPDVQLNIRAGEQFKLKDLLYSLMLESHNDVAVAIAEHVGGSVEGFAKLMNKKAEELGCTHTHFVTPNGLDANGHYTTAAELAKIASYAIQNEEFINITNTSTWQFTELKNGRSFTVSNKDRFLYMYNGAIGVKTGFTGKAGYCFVGAVKRDGKTFVSAVLAAGWPPHKTYKWADTTELMDYGINNYELKQIFNEDKVFNPVYVEDGQESFVDLYYHGDISLLMREDEKVNIVYDVPTKMEAPITADAEVGSAKYYVGDDLIKEVPIYTKTSIAKIDFEYCIKKISNLWLTGQWK